MSEYEHSRVFEGLKNTKESILENYSSDQYFTVLDSLIYSALAPIVENMDFLTPLLAEVVHHASNNAKRKITNLKREEFNSRFSIFLASPPDKRLEVLKSMRLERTILRLCITKFLAATQDYPYLMQARIKKEDIRVRLLEKDLGVFPESNKSMLAIISEVNVYFKESKKFKTEILEKYNRFICMEAKRIYQHINLRIEMDSIIQTLYVFASYALDKYDSGQGTLTSYIQRWLDHARDKIWTNETQISYEVPKDKKDQIDNRAESLDDLVSSKEYAEEDDIDIEQHMRTQRVRQLAKFVDPLGLGRLSLDIQELLNTEEIHLLMTRRVVN